MKGIGSNGMAHASAAASGGEKQRRAAWRQRANWPGINESEGGEISMAMAASADRSIEKWRGGIKKCETK